MRRTPPVLVALAVALIATAAFGPTSLASAAPAAAPGLPQLRFGAVPEVAEGGPDTSTTVTVDVTIGAPSATPSSWRWATYPEVDFIDEILPSTAGVDYVATEGVVTFAPGETHAQVSVTVLGDARHEATEFIALVAVRDEDPIDLSTLATGAIHILDDDRPPTVLPGVAWVSEADGPGAVLHLPVTLSAPSGLDVVVSWTTLNVAGAPPNQAFSPGDYVASSGTVVFSGFGGVTSAVVDIPIVDDAVAEPDEYVVVSFHHPTGATMGGFWGLGFGGIHSDD